MSNKWKVIIGIVAVVIVIGAGLGWFMINRGWTLSAFIAGPQAITQLEVRLLDDNKDGIPDRGVVDLPLGPSVGRGFALERLSQERGPQVRLVDDNGDGIPDRGVMDRPLLRDFGRRLEPARRADFGLRFDAGGRFRPLGLIFNPFFIIGWMFRLVGVALLIGLGIFIGRRWGSPRPPAPVAPAEAPGPVRAGPENPPTPTSAGPEPEENSRS
ncbi:MAG: hypothetical protein AB1801_12690 [Chloroflexota bacterium]